MRRVVDFRGKFEPVTHICRATLEGGALCSRRDRVKCPFHGIIVVRDDEGNVVDSKEVKSSLNNQQEVRTYIFVCVFWMRSHSITGIFSHNHSLKPLVHHTTCTSSGDDLVNDFLLVNHI